MFTIISFSSLPLIAEDPILTHWSKDVGLEGSPRDPFEDLLAPSGYIISLIRVSLSVLVFCFLLIPAFPITYV